MNADDALIGCSLAFFVFAAGVLFLVFAAGASGCIDSETFRNRTKVIVITNPDEIEEVLK